MVYDRQPRKKCRQCGLLKKRELFLDISCPDEPRYLAICISCQQDNQSGSSGFQSDKKLDAQELAGRQQIQKEKNQKKQSTKYITTKDSLHAAGKRLKQSSKKPFSKFAGTSAHKKTQKASTSALSRHRRTETRQAGARNKKQAGKSFAWLNNKSDKTATPPPTKHSKTQEAYTTKASLAEVIAREGATATKENKEHTENALTAQHTNLGAIEMAHMFHNKQVDKAGATTPPQSEAEEKNTVDVSR